MGRDTRTGGVLEAMVLPSLVHGGYTYSVGVNIGSRLGGGRHLVDVIAQKDNVQYLISLKWQQTTGTAEQKIPFEVLCLIDALQTNPGKFRRAYLVLGGGGWKLRNFYVTSLNKYLNHADFVTILDLEGFVARANTSRL